MATQKKYHDLVILENKNTGAKQVNAKKLISGILFFLIGIFLGAFLVAVLDNKNSELSQTPPSIIQPSLPSTSDTSLRTTEIQSITSITTTSGKSGCGIESLGRNNPEGCSADSFTETPLEATENNSSEITDLNFIDTPKDSVNDNNTVSTPDSGVTNILDLQ